MLFRSRADQLIETKQDGVSVNYTYDKAGNLLTDGRNTYTYNLQNQLTRQTGADGTVNYAYDAAGNLISDGETTYSYNAENRLILGEKANGESSSYIYNALGVRIGNEQIRENENAGHQNRTLIAGSQWLERYHDVLLDGRFDWQRVFETEVGTTVQNNFETVTKHYVVDYLSVANRDILVTEDGSYTQTYVYDENSARISAEYSYAPGTARGEGGENLASDFADAAIEKIWYRRSLLDSSLFAVDADGEVIAHMTYDAWGRPEKETYFGVNYAGIDNFNNYTGYTYDEVLELYFAQNRFYDPQTKGFTQEDPIKDGLNWYSYVSNNPLVFVDPWGLVEVGLRAYARTYSNSIVAWDDSTETATVTWDGITLSVGLTANNHRDGHIYVDDSLLVNAFGVGNEKLVVYQDAVTNNVSIRALFNISGNAANIVNTANASNQSRKMTGASYRAHFLQGIEDYWSGPFEEYSVSTYTEESSSGIKVNVSQVNFSSETDYSKMYGGYSEWSKTAPGSIDMFTGDSRSEHIYTVDNFKWVAAHEFGHILGVGDMYINPDYAGVKSIFNNFGTPVYKRDIDMVLKAWNTGEWQAWP